MNKKAVTELYKMAGFAIAAVILLIFMFTFIFDEIGLAAEEKMPEGIMKAMNEIGQALRKVSEGSSAKPVEFNLAIEDNWAIVGFGKFDTTVRDDCQTGDNFIDKPSRCGAFSCICVCQEMEDANDLCKGRRECIPLPEVKKLVVYDKTGLDVAVGGEHLDFKGSNGEYVVFYGDCGRGYPTWDLRRLKATQMGDTTRIDILARKE